MAGFHTRRKTIQGSQGRNIINPRRKSMIIKNHMSITTQQPLIRMYELSNRGYV